MKALRTAIGTILMIWASQGMSEPLGGWDTFTGPVGEPVSEPDPKQGCRPEEIRRCA